MHNVYITTLCITLFIHSKRVKVPLKFPWQLDGNTANVLNMTLSSWNIISFCLFFSCLFSIGSITNVSPQKAGEEPLHHRHRPGFPRQQQQQQRLWAFAALLLPDPVPACSSPVPQATGRGHGPLGGRAVRPGLLRRPGRWHRRGAGEGDRHSERWRRVLQVRPSRVGRTGRPRREDGGTRPAVRGDEELQPEWTSRDRKCDAGGGSRWTEARRWFRLCRLLHLLRRLSIPLCDPDYKARPLEAVRRGGGRKQGPRCHLGAARRLCQRVQQRRLLIWDEMKEKKTWESLGTSFKYVEPGGEKRV